MPRLADLLIGLLFVLLHLLPGAAPVAVAQSAITLASTTSTQNSGLYDHILPLFEAETGIRVNVVAVGTGQALRIARNGDADILIVHHRASEEAFVADGHGIGRRDLMWNDFVIIGPRADPAGVADAPGVAEAFRMLLRHRAPFISRGDSSGTHLRELEIWRRLPASPSGEWYREIGSGMGATLNMAAAINAYTLSDRGTWLSFGNKADLALLHEGDRILHNPYGVILVNPARHPHVRAAEARRLRDWLVSPRGQAAIGSFRIGGQVLFCPQAEPRAGGPGCIP